MAQICAMKLAYLVSGLETAHHSNLGCYSPTLITKIYLFQKESTMLYKSENVVNKNIYYIRNIKTWTKEIGKK